MPNVSRRGFQCRWLQSKIHASIIHDKQSLVHETCQLFSCSKTMGEGFCWLCITRATFLYIAGLHPVSAGLVRWHCGGMTSTGSCLCLKRAHSQVVFRTRSCQVTRILTGTDRCHLFLGKPDTEQEHELHPHCHDTLNMFSLYNQGYVTLVNNCNSIIEFCWLWRNRQWQQLHLSNIQLAVIASDLIAQLAG